MRWRDWCYLAEGRKCLHSGHGSPLLELVSVGNKGGNCQLKSTAYFLPVTQHSLRQMSIVVISTEPKILPPPPVVLSLNRLNNSRKRNKNKEQSSNYCEVLLFSSVTLLHQQSTTKVRANYLHHVSETREKKHDLNLPVHWAAPRGTGIMWARNHNMGHSSLLFNSFRILLHTESHRAVHPQTRNQVLEGFGGQLKFPFQHLEDNSCYVGSLTEEMLVKVESPVVPLPGCSAIGACDPLPRC